MIEKIKSLNRNIFKPQNWRDRYEPDPALNTDAIKTRMLQKYAHSNVHAFLQIDSGPNEDFADGVIAARENGYILTGSITADLRSDWPMRLQILVGTEKEEAIAMVKGALESLEHIWECWSAEMKMEQSIEPQMRKGQFIVVGRKLNDKKKMD